MTNYSLVVVALALCSTFATRISDEPDEELKPTAATRTSDELRHNATGSFVQVDGESDEEGDGIEQEAEKINVTEENEDGIVKCGGLDDSVSTAGKKAKAADDEVARLKKLLEVAEKAAADAKTGLKHLQQQKSACGECAGRAGPGWVFSGGVCKLACNKPGIICKGHKLPSGYYWSSGPNEKNRLVMTKSGYLKVKTGSRGGSEKWSTECGCSFCRHCTFYKGYTIFENNCHLTISPPKWAPKVLAEPRAGNSCDDTVYMVIQDDCNLVMYNSKKPIWDIGARC